MEDKESIYANYRASIRSQRASDGGNGLTSVRKQKALKVTADRYNLPMGRVKVIVREEDAKRGITHRFPGHPTPKQAFEHIFNTALMKFGKAPCQSCGIDHSSGLVRPRFVNKLDAGEAHMERILVQAGLKAPYFTGLPKNEDFVQLCYTCKLHNLGFDFSQHTKEHS